VAQSEIGTVVDFDPNPVAINQIIKNDTTRGHFISILYSCSLPSDFTPDNSSLSATEPGFLKWQDKCPDNLIKVHDVFYTGSILKQLRSAILVAASLTDSFTTE
jgi:colanic acid biosynthesis protein WcaH|tara:strand:- start:1828 stop:2139 length:312 start_codon:yes stop_codon:yes gene_type:complete